MSEVKIEGVMAGWSEYEKKFADIIIEFVEGKCKDHKRPLESIRLSAENLNASYSRKLIEIYRERQPRPSNMSSEQIAKEMLRALFWKCEIDTTLDRRAFTLNTDGELYKVLEEMMNY